MYNIKNKIWKSCLLFCAIMAICNQANAFNVGGIISSDTTWASTSEPYIIVSPIQIASGVTLSIEKGVIVNGGSIAVFGTLDVNGDAGSRVLFDGVHVLQGSNTSSVNNSFHIDISYAEFNAGSLYEGSGYGSLTLTDSILRNTPNMYIWYPVADVHIERNIFLESGGISIGTHYGITVNIRNNIFSGLTTYPAVESWASYDSSQTIVEFNSFLDTDKTALHLSGGGYSGAIIGKNNWWGTTDTSIIEKMIYDRNDDVSVVNIIDYLPILTEPHPNTPIFSTNGHPTANAGSDQIVFDAITLNGSQSSDNEDDSLTYSWVVTNRNNMTSPQSYSGSSVIIHNLKLGFYDVILTVTDPDGLSDTSTMIFTATGPAKSGFFVIPVRVPCPE